MSDTQPTCAIISPALANANNGNWHTAARWKNFLAADAKVSIALAWDGAPVDVMIALHACRSADSVARFAHAYPDRPLIVVLTGTDLYRDIKINRAAMHSLEVATHLVVLQDQALLELAPSLRQKARVIIQSAPRLARIKPNKTTFDFIAVGHLRAEKDPLTLMRAVQALPAASPIRLIHIGDALDHALGDAARQTMAGCAHYRWLGGLPRTRTRRWIARSQALIHPSVMEGGAHVIIEAVQSQVPVLASHISGNIGMLSEDYDGYFPLGDAEALAKLMLRFASDQAFAAHLRAQCAARAALFEPRHEQQLVRQLFNDAKFIK
ncbi:MAG: selenoneine biosynthesis selenosugar synthase SenB [Burkholderiales bacterium]|nr:selenoneine biosynthesis selenosugar synthase SenB [Burkholderiales bacterium]